MGKGDNSEVFSLFPFSSSSLFLVKSWSLFLSPSKKAVRGDWKFFLSFLLFPFCLEGAKMLGNRGVRRETKKAARSITTFPSHCTFQFAPSPSDCLHAFLGYTVRAANPPWKKVCPNVFGRRTVPRSREFEWEKFDFSKSNFENKRGKSYVPISSPCLWRGGRGGGGNGYRVFWAFFSLDPILGTGMRLVRHSPDLTPSSFLPSLMPQSCSFWLLGVSVGGGGLFTATCLTT